MIQYFYPPQPTRIWPNSSLLPSFSNSRDWDAEIKYNGWRLLVFKLEQDKILLYNRHSTIIDIDWQQFIHAFEDVPVGSVFDGELLDRRTKDLKNIIVLWDTCFYNGSDLRLKPLKDRRHFLEQISVLLLLNYKQILAQNYQNSGPQNQRNHLKLKFLKPNSSKLIFLIYIISLTKGMIQSKRVLFLKTLSLHTNMQQDQALKLQTG
jgi:hypothetical protein